jgi:hypothetical protein
VEHSHEEHDPDQELGDLDRIAERERVRGDGAVEETPIPGRACLRHVLKLRGEARGKVPCATFARPETSHS